MTNSISKVLSLFIVALFCGNVLNAQTSFADDIIFYESGCTTNSATDPTGSLGSPDFVSAGNTQHFVSLGAGGVLIIEFVDNQLTNSGDSTDDLLVHEVGPIAEDCEIAVRPADNSTYYILEQFSIESDQDGYYPVGSISGNDYSIDIDLIWGGVSSGQMRFDAVRIEDINGICNLSTPGADIDAVEALSSKDCTGECQPLEGCYNPLAENYIPFATVEVPCVFSGVCVTELTPNSEVLTLNEQMTSSFYLPSGYQHEAELVLSINKNEIDITSASAIALFHSTCDGLSNTLVAVSGTQEGAYPDFKYVGYNEGMWSSDGQIQTALNNNFLLNPVLDIYAPASVGQNHITNNASTGPNFNSFYLSGSGVLSTCNQSELNYLCNCEFNQGNINLCSNYLTLGNTNTGSTGTSWDILEVWQLKTNGNDVGSFADLDNDGICDLNEVEGCTSSEACNYYNLATEDDGSCIFPGQNCEVCSGETDGTGVVLVHDDDNDGVCNDNEIIGCQDPTATNFDPTATDSGLCIYPETRCISNLTPGSSILNGSDQSLLLSWIPAGFAYQAELVYNSSISGSEAETVHAAVDGLSHTLLVAISDEGFVYGGYNEGFWASSGIAQTGLNNNFLFSTSFEEIYPAIPGEIHITNSSSGLVFGSNISNSDDLSFASSSSPGVITRNSLGNSYYCPAAEDSCELYLNNGIGWSFFNDRFATARWEVWQLKTSGTPVIIETDTDNDGVCDMDEVDGCTSPEACNYYILATEDDNSCIYAEQNCEACSGENDGSGVVLDLDEDDDGICNEDEIVGCQDPAGTNYNPAATDSEICIYPETRCVSNLTPGSSILDGRDQSLLLSWIPAGFEYEAELVYDSSVSGSLPSTVHDAVDGLSHTLLVAVSEEGFIFGGYNEGIWEDDGALQTGLDNNFLYSISFGEIYPAIPGETHISNSSSGLRFGTLDTDFPDFSFSASSTPGPITRNSLGNSYFCPVIGASCELYLNNGIGYESFTDRFETAYWELWQLKTSGEPVAIGEDCDGDGLCQFIELAGCKNQAACNYNRFAVQNNYSCIFANSNCEACSGEIDGTGVVLFLDDDNDGICNQDEIAGCQDPAATNYDRAATDSGLCFYCDSRCVSNLTPESNILDGHDQSLVLSWLPTGFEYEAELVYDSFVSGSLPSTVHAAVDGLSHTLVVAISEQGYIYGGYNEGIWEDDGALQTGLDNNFLFSVSFNKTYPAIPGETHITNSTSGLMFGTLDTEFPDLSFAASSTSETITLNYLVNSYLCPATGSSCQLYLNNGIGYAGFTDRFETVRWEVWQLNTSGEALVILDDLDGDGVCDNAEEVGCMDETACNYSALAQVGAECIYAEQSCEICSGETDGTGEVLILDDDNDGICNTDEIIGCINSDACNYNPLSTDEGECHFPDGCTDPLALNFTALARCDDNSCLYTGCTDASSSNYNPNANFDDGSCESYGENFCPGDFTGDGVVSAADLTGFLSSFGEVCE